MGKLVRFGLIGIGVILALCVVGALFRGGSNTPKITPAATVQAQSQSQAAPTTAPAQEQATAAPAAQPAEESTAAPAQPSVANVGDRIESAGVALTIVKIDRAKELGQFLKAEDGKVYLLAEAVVENAGRDEKTPYNPLYFKVKDTDGFEYNASLMGPDNSLKSGDLDKGDKARGVVAFEVPETAKGLVLSYEPMVLFGGYEPIKVKLGE